MSFAGILGGIFCFFSFFNIIFEIKRAKNYRFRFIYEFVIRNGKEGRKEKRKREEEIVYRPRTKFRFSPPPSDD